MATTATLVETVTSVSPAEVNTTVPRKSLGTTLPGEIEMVDVVTVPLLGVDTKVAVDRSESKTELLRSAFLDEVADAVTHIQRLHQWWTPWTRCQA
jgi:hypothetical protein